MKVYLQSESYTEGPPPLVRYAAPLNLKLVDSALISPSYGIEILCMVNCLNRTVGAAVKAEPVLYDLLRVEVNTHIHKNIYVYLHLTHRRCPVVESAIDGSETRFYGR
jgi:hypothetical protein